MKPILFLYISGIVAAETVSQFSMKKYHDGGEKEWWLFLAGWLLYLPVLVFLNLAYNHSDFAMTNALWDSGTIIVMGTVGVLYFKETLNKGEIAGMSLVVLGAILLGYFGDNVKDKD